MLTALYGKQQHHLSYDAKESCNLNEKYINSSETAAFKGFSAAGTTSN